MTNVDPAGVLALGAAATVVWPRASSLVFVAAVVVALTLGAFFVGVAGSRPRQPPAP